MASLFKKVQWLSPVQMIPWLRRSRGSMAALFKKVQGPGILKGLVDQ